jgi:hypothetical protein
MRSRANPSTGTAVERQQAPRTVGAAHRIERLAIERGPFDFLQRIGHAAEQIPWMARREIGELDAPAQRGGQTAVAAAWSTRWRLCGAALTSRSTLTLAELLTRSSLHRGALWGAKREKRQRAAERPGDGGDAEDEAEHRVPPLLSPVRNARRCARVPILLLRRRVQPDAEHHADDGAGGADHRGRRWQSESRTAG